MRPETPHERSPQRFVSRATGAAGVVGGALLIGLLNPSNAYAEEMDSPSLQLAAEDTPSDSSIFQVPQSSRGSAAEQESGQDSDQSEDRSRSRGREDTGKQQPSPKPTPVPVTFGVPSTSGSGSGSGAGETSQTPAPFIPQIPTTRSREDTPQPADDEPTDGTPVLPPATPAQPPVPGQTPEQTTSTAPPNEPEPEDPPEPEVPPVTPAPVVEAPAPAPPAPAEVAPAPPPAPVSYAHPCPTCNLNQDFNPGHGGIDMDEAVGGPLYAVADAIVEDAGPRDPNGFGQVIYLRLADGTIVKYGHIDQWIVNKGDIVVAGQKIGTVGNRGSVRRGPGGDGSHLHLEVHINPTGVNGTKVNPVQWLRDHGVQI